MSIFLDLSLIALVALTIFFYWYRGIIRSLLGVAKAVLAVIFTYLFGGMLSSVIEQHIMLPALTDLVGEKILTLFSQGAEQYDLSVVFSSMPAWLSGLLETFHVDTAALQAQYASIVNGTSEQLHGLALSIATPVAALLSDIIGYAAIFLISVALLTVAAFLLTKMAELPVIKTFDRTGGLLLGVLLALLYGSVFVVVIYSVFGWLEVRNSSFAFAQAYRSSFLFKYAYQFNLFKLLFGI